MPQLDIAIGEALFFLGCKEKGSLDPKDQESLCE